MATESKMKLNRIEWIDITKGIAIFLMVIGHTSIPVPLSKWIWSFHMPLFFIISGLLFNKEKYTSIKYFFKSRIRSLAIPYIVFSSIILFTRNDLSWTRWLYEGWMNGWALWFIPVLFITELFCFYLTRLNYLIIISFTIAFIGCIFCWTSIRLPYNLDVCFMAGAFYLIGFIFKDKIKELQFKRILVIALLITNLVLSLLLPRTDMANNACGIYPFNMLNAIIGTVSIILFSKLLVNNKYLIIFRRFYNWAGSNTIIILGLSQWINILMKDSLGNNSLPFLSIGRHILLWLFLWIISLVLNRYFPFLIGKKTK